MNVACRNIHLGVDIKFQEVATLKGHNTQHSGHMGSTIFKLKNQ